MPSEKTRYVETRMSFRRAPPMEYRDVEASLSKVQSDVLSRVITRATRGRDPLGRIMYLHAVYATTPPRDIARLEQVIRYALALDGEYVPYDRSGAYSQVLHEVQYVLADLVDGGYAETAERLCSVAIEEAETSAECLQDGAYWEMALDNLRQWYGRILEA